MSNAKWLETLALSNIEVNDDIKNGEITSVKVKQSDNSWRIFVTLSHVLPWNVLDEMFEKIRSTFISRGCKFFIIVEMSIFVLAPSCFYLLNFT